MFWCFGFRVQVFRVLGVKGLGVQGLGVQGSGLGVQGWMKIVWDESDIGRNRFWMKVSLDEIVSVLDESVFG